jgi:UDP-N-acetyl-2-amino-2-deoxyglucuronate dehydrogenase
MKNFALIGVGGFIAVRHLKAIKETNNNLLAALDKNDSVGILDSYFPKADFFTEFERFDRHIDKLKRKGNQIDYVSICTPNYLHDSHIRFALRHGADAICEKPIVLNPWNLDALAEIEKETGKKIFNILQLRLHKAIVDLKKEFDSKPKTKIYDIDLVYITSRGNWYFNSWKADIDKSGGIATNIGVHFFDMLSWIFGEVKENIVHVSTPSTTSGFMQLERARVRWFLSVDENTLPQHIREKGQRTFRSIQIEGKELEFSEGFTDLHTDSYKHILSGNGFGLMEAKPSIDIVYQIRNSNPVGIIGDFHPFCIKT